MMGEPLVRNLAAADAPACVKLSEAEGWRHTLPGWQRNLALGKDGCFGLEVDGALISTGIAISHGHKRAWISMVLTHPDHRRKGYATRIMERILAHLKDKGVEQIGLDSRENALALYEKLGFKAAGQVGVWWGDASQGERSRIAPLTFSVLPRAIKFDEAIFGVARATFFSKQMEEFPDMAWIDQEDKEIAGLLVAQEQQAGQIHLGPWEHKTPDGAEKLLRHALAVLSGARVMVQAPENNAAAKNILEKLSFKYDHACTRMYFEQEAPSEDKRDWYYGIGGFTIG